jgi:hypothetical protein
MMRIAIGRSGDQFVSKIEPGKRVDRGNLKRVVNIKIRKQAGNSLGQHCLPDARRPMKEHVMATGSGHLAGPLGLNLTHDIRQVETTARVLAGLLPHHFDRLNKRHRLASQKGDQLGDRGNTKDLDPFNQLGLSTTTAAHARAEKLAADPSTRSSCVITKKINIMMAAVWPLLVDCRIHIVKRCPLRQAEPAAARLIPGAALHRPPMYRCPYLTGRRWPH